MVDYFGKNDAALAFQEVTYHVRILDGCVHNNNNGKKEEQEEPGIVDKEKYLTLTATVGSFQLTQASRLAAQAIAAMTTTSTTTTTTTTTRSLYGTIVDWGCGGGVLALLAAAASSTVDLAVGLDCDAQNISTGRLNARKNGLEHKVKFFRTDSFQPLDAKDADELIDILQNKVDFVIGNPPAWTSGSLAKQAGRADWNWAVGKTTRDDSNPREELHTFWAAMAKLLVVTQEVGRHVVPLSVFLGFHYRWCGSAQGWAIELEGSVQRLLHLVVRVVGPHRSVA